jgi:hypothetical protein
MPGCFKAACASVLGFGEQVFRPRSAWGWGVNAGSLPLGFAPFRVVTTSPDGSEEKGSPFQSEDLAKSTATFLRIHAPANSYRVVRETPVLPGLEGRV